MTRSAQSAPTSPSTRPEIKRGTTFIYNKLIIILSELLKYHPGRKKENEGRKGMEEGSEERKGLRRKEGKEGRKGMNEGREERKNLGKKEGRRRGIKGRNGMNE